MSQVLQRLPVLGMTCASCAISLETFLKDLNGIAHIQVNYASQQVEVEYDSDTIDINQIKSKASEIGYQLLIDDASDTSILQQETNRRSATLRKKLIVAVLFSLPVFVLSMFFMDAFNGLNFVLLLLTLPVMFYSGSGFFIKAWQQLKHRSSTMDTLVALSTGIAFLFSLLNTIWPNYLSFNGMVGHVYYESAVVIITFILFGRYLEEIAKNRTTAAIQKLIGLTPNQSAVIRNGLEVEIPTNEIMLGDLVLVKPGEKFPVDGKIKRGNTTADESLMTGESLPIEKQKGSEVIAGSINQDGVVQVLAKKVGEQTTLSEMIRLVSSAQNSKPKIQKTVDKIASIFVPVVILVAALTATVWYVFGPIPQYQFAITASITVLIVACPCALGLATPTALMVGVGVGSHNGILIRDAQALEALYKANTIILDKTGTLTKGQPTVVDSIWIDSAHREKYIAVLCAVENSSTHPLAKSILTHCKSNTIPAASIDTVQNKVGMGMTAMFDGKRCLVGSLKLIDFEQANMSTQILERSLSWKDKPISTVFFAIDGQVIAAFALGDTVRPTSRAFIDSVKNLGVKPVVLSGDNESAVSTVAMELGIKEYLGGQSPEEKARYIVRLQATGNVVAMLGDGVNDAVALTQSDIGIAMGSGSDIAMESAGITLMHSDPQHVVKALRLSRGTIKTIRTNLFWAFIYNIISIPIAAGVLYPINGFLLHPMIAGAAMSLSSVSVLLNSLRLKKIKI